MSIFLHDAPRVGALGASSAVNTPKTVGAAQRIAAGSGETLRLGRLDVIRDWGWAPEYVDAMWRISQQDGADRFAEGLLRVGLGEQRTGQFVVDKLVLAVA